MINKRLNLFILFYLFFVFNCFSQNKADSLSNNRVTTQFNSYLKITKLDTLIKAVDFSFKRHISQNGSLGQINLSSVHVLSLETNDALSPMKFIGVWNATLNKIGKNAVYTNLFLKLCGFTVLPPDSLMINIGSEGGGLYSFMIYFDNSIKVNEPLVGIKGNADTAINIGPSNLYNSLYGGFLRKVQYRSKLKEDMVTAIKTFLRGREKDKNIPLSQPFGDATVTFIESNVKGHVTNNFYEVITVQFNFNLAPDRKTADVSFSFNVIYSGGPMNLAIYYKYENAIASFQTQVSAYGASLRSVLQNTIDGKTN